MNENIEKRVMHCVRGEQYDANAISCRNHCSSVAIVDYSDQGDCAQSAVYGVCHRFVDIGGYAGCDGNFYE